MLCLWRGRNLRGWNPTALWHNEVPLLLRLETAEMKKWSLKEPILLLPLSCLIRFMYLDEVVLQFILEYFAIHSQIQIIMLLCKSDQYCVVLLMHSRLIWPTIWEIKYQLKHNWGSYKEKHWIIIISTWFTRLCLFAFWFGVIRTGSFLASLWMSELHTNLRHK